MTREQYNEYLYIRKEIRYTAKNQSTTAIYNISVNYCTELKQKVHDELEAIGYYPCRVGLPYGGFNINGDEKIIYIWYGTEESWHEATFQWEREMAAKAINA